MNIYISGSRYWTKREFGMFNERSLWGDSSPQLILTVLPISILAWADSDSCEVGEYPGKPR